MSRKIESSIISIDASNSIISFETAGSDRWEVWDRYLCINGEKAYHIGNICGTCSFFFERLDGANKSISPDKVVDKLRQGLTNLEKVLLDNISTIMPKGEYSVNLLTVNPKLINVGSDIDYFNNEQIQEWGIDGFWEFPHHPKINYYRGETKEFSKNKILFEFIVPMFPQGWLNKDKVNEFITMVNQGGKPTALAISILDIKQVYDSQVQHWCLTHYLIDGHHKIFASSTEDKPITLLSYLAVKEGISNTEEIDEMLRNI